MTENVLLEIQKTFDFFKATAASDRIDRILLSGGASTVDGFAEHSQSASARRSNRSIRSRKSPSTCRSSPDRATCAHLLPTAAVAVGLALRKARGPMIRINLLADRTQGRRRSGSRFGHRSAAGGRGGLILAAVRGLRRLALLAWSPTIRRGSTRKSPRPSRRRSACSRVLAQVQQFEQRKAQLAAACRADRTAPPRPDRSGAHAGPDQPRAAADGVADRASSRRRSPTRS